MELNVLLIGSGAREHALACKLTQSPLLKKLYCLTNNPGLAKLANRINIAYDYINHQAIIDICKQKQIDLVIIGPEQPIINGLADTLEQHNIATFAPLKAAAQLESSKIFTRNLLAPYNVAMPKFKAFYDIEAAKLYINNQSLPIVIKADGPAFGKGVFIAETIEQAHQAIAECSKKYGPAILIEEFLTGQEISFFVLCDGENFTDFGYARDYKRLYDQDKGPNTGGMGAYSGPDLLTAQHEHSIIKNIIKPSFIALKDKGLHYKGILFAGIMLTPAGPKLLEYNVRLGDPECQALLPRLQSDILPLFFSAAKGELKLQQAVWHEFYTATIVVTTKDYPGKLLSNDRINLTKFMQVYSKNADIELFCANVIQQDPNQPNLLTPQGGRLLSITAKASSLRRARQLAYKACATINYPSGFYRTDIGK